MFTSESNGAEIVCVTCRRLCPRPLEKQAELIAAAGVKKLILREKDLTEQEYQRLAEKMLERCEILGIECILHTFSKTAERLGCRKIHIPLHLMSSKLKESFSTLGCSVHNVEEAVKAQQLGATYLTAGHIFATDCKKGLPPRGLDFLSEVCRSVSIPVYAIGGINSNNINSAISAGAAGVCIMSGLMKLSPEDLHQGLQ